jgi:hypothetical protein
MQFRTVKQKYINKLSKFCSWAFRGMSSFFRGITNTVPSPRIFSGTQFRCQPYSHKSTYRQSIFNANTRQGIRRICWSNKNFVLKLLKFCISIRPWEVVAMVPCSNSRYGKKIFTRVYSVQYTDSIRRISWLLPSFAQKNCRIFFKNLRASSFSKTPIEWHYF